ncbi:Gfo/Idh/MocA family protein [Tautonia plasticadhaerens]|uniref:1,5-anhydro-D-fructose reductase n=1 Tax=Tautonia plasticadhaerens TaxID=2527974 RepID=A0A518H4H1_9BACT|nr:Gfo/Idh/MocA family oxidoreductase [Tautonia plasticadhaerens]QDV35740.1 1,5-anhydro-D-fructose reductase [Tautonia plasticadhaerens]
MKPVRFGLIGYGAWGVHHARVLSGTDGAALVSIAGRSADSCDAARRDHPGAAIYDDYAAMLDREQLDAVAVVLPSHLHSEAGAAVLRSGRHLLLEKPMALDLADCDALISLARDRRLTLAVGHEFRLSSLWGGVKRMVDDGAIGVPRYALIELWRRPYRTGSGGWRYDPGRVGSWILEEPIHFFDLARWYLSGPGEPVAVTARGSSKRADRPELLDNFSAFVDFPGGAYAVISQTLAAFEHHQVVKLTGTEGALWASWGGAMDRTFHPSYSLKYFDGQTVVDIPIDRPTGEVFELEEQAAMMVRAVRDGTPPAVSGEDGRRSVALCLAARRSIETGETVRMDPTLDDR